MSTQYRLSSVYRPSSAETQADWAGTFDLRLEAVDGVLPPSFQLAVWCARRLELTDATDAAVVERTAGHVVFEPSPEALDVDARVWVIEALSSTIGAHHANDGPEAAYVISSDGETLEVDVAPCALDGVAPGSVVPSAPAPPPDDRVCPTVPYPQTVHASGSSGSARLRLDPTSVADGVGVWRSVKKLGERLGVQALHLAGDADARPVRLVSTTAFDHPDRYALEVDEDGVVLESAGVAGFRWGLITLAQWAAAGLPAQATVEDWPTLDIRVVHLDLARRWYEPEMVERLIDLAAWRKFRHVHLHLTDDEAWRVPVPDYPLLGTVGGTRGQGLAIPPLCASGPGPYGRCYTTTEIGRWVDRADELGITLVPEVDVPGHAFAALAAYPSMRDPNDRSRALGPQGYVNNVLVPGHPETEPFLRSVFGHLANLFPTSPVLHIGGDEVPDGAWAGSPIAQQRAGSLGLESKQEIEADFHRRLIDMILFETGREVAMWQDAAFAGVAPGAYAVSWTSPQAATRLADAGHRVVSAPGQKYYLDMATGPEWDLPGASWAGHVSIEATCAFDPHVGLSDPHALVGVQACIWSEHVADIDVLDALVFPRLDAVAERGWTGRIEGGHRSLTHRASLLPRFGSG